MYINFQNNQIPKDDKYFTCLSVMLLDFIFVNSNKKYYLEISLKERRYVTKN